jgi:hypothetical protein
VNVNAISSGFNPIVAPSPIQGTGQASAAEGGFGKTMSDALESVGAL